MDNHIILQNHDGVLEIIFNRPNKKNAITNTMYHDIQTAMQNALHDDNIKVVLFSANGDFFTAGNDIADFVEISQNADLTFNALDFVKFLGEFPKPIVASVTGSAVGIGTTMLLHSDLVYISKTAKLLTPFVNLGLVPEAGSSLLLTERIGYNRAFSMFVMNEGLIGEQAVNFGIANTAFDNADDVLATARQKAVELANKPVQAVLQTKALMRHTTAILAKIHQENACFAERLQSEEAQMILQQFLTKK